ncbi:uncharacterized protein LOC62_04G005461 [Vanrija pseudolonga]|uniref:Uncharacterized protein n=1 Tax=Vanrija pseudolonga TaxID=143232 RepID=A0AAF0YBV5_9TREE|nr:hypothetical protein LOC62_04G005461 [Vanrija pseudolonga]
MARKPNFPPFVPGRIVHGKYRLVLRPHRPSFALGTVPAADAGTSPSPYASLAATFECVTVEQDAEGTTITITISQAEETAPDEIEAFERVMSSINAARFVDLEVSHEFDEFFEAGGRRYKCFAIFHRLRNPTLRRLRVDARFRGFGFYDARGPFLQYPAWRGLQTLVLTGSDGSQNTHLSLVQTLLLHSRSLLAICIGRCGGVLPGRACTCWDDWDRKEFNFNGMARVVKMGYGSFEHIWRMVAAHRRTIKRTQVAAMNLLLLAHWSPLPPEIWSMVGEYLEADGIMDAPQFNRARELVPLATLAQRALAMRDVETEQFGEALEEWLAAEGFSYGAAADQVTSTSSTGPVSTDPS